MAGRFVGRHSVMSGYVGLPTGACAMLVGIHGFAYGNTSAMRIEGVSKSAVFAPPDSNVNDASHALPRRIGAVLGMYQNATPVWRVLVVKGFSGDSGVA